MDSVPVDSIVGLLRNLVQTPSRAGEDDLDPVCALVERWFVERNLGVREIVSREGKRLGTYVEIRGKRDGRWTILDATLDTAGFGDLQSWSRDPTSAHVADGWLCGRGAADSKAAVALFSHLIVELCRWRELSGRIGVLFDCDEHTGVFGGARAFFDQPFEAGGLPPRPNGVLIGYPGMDRIVVGCRGFVRARLTIHGIAAHSGSSRTLGVNAVSRAAALCRELDAWTFPGPTAAFTLAPKLTVTGLRGGSDSFSQVPDACELRVDIRLTPDFSETDAQHALAAGIAAFDAGLASVAPTEIHWMSGWPAYRLEPDEPMVIAMQAACRSELNAEVPTAVVGPSNIGNYLAALGVPALCGFGVRAEGIHAADERIALDSLEPVYRIYRAALRTLHQS